MTEVTREEFVERFVAHMIKVAGRTFDDGTSIEEYAREVAPTYWDEPDQRAEGPEESAESDVSCWGE